MSSASMSIAVFGGAGRAEVAFERFARAGFVAIPDSALTRTSGGDVWHVARSADERELLELAGVARAYARTARSVIGAAAVTRKRVGAFQPVWTVHPLMRPIGFELLCIDDGDACAQLDTLYAVLAGDRLLAGARRSHMTINPRGCWQGYGHPDITRRG